MANTLIVGKCLIFMLSVSFALHSTHFPSSLLDDLREVQLSLGGSNFRNYVSKYCIRDRHCTHSRIKPALDLYDYEEKRSHIW